MNDTITLDNEIKPNSERRRKLLPIWIKIFLWIFMAFGVLTPIGLIYGILGINFDLSLYGLETTKALSITGMFIMSLFVFKALISFGLWTEKDWVINLAIIDAILGIIVCTFVMLVLPFFLENNGLHFSIRLELIALIPYLIKMRQIKANWIERKS